MGGIWPQPLCSLCLCGEIVIWDLITSENALCFYSSNARFQTPVLTALRPIGLPSVGQSSRRVAAGGLSKAAVERVNEMNHHNLRLISSMVYMVVLPGPVVGPPKVFSRALRAAFSFRNRARRRNSLGFS